MQKEKTATGSAVMNLAGWLSRKRTTGAHGISELSSASTPATLSSHNARFKLATEKETHVEISSTILNSGRKACKISPRISLTMSINPKSTFSSMTTTWRIIVKTCARPNGSASGWNAIQVKLTTMMILAGRKPVIMNAKKANASSGTPKSTTTK